MTFDKALKTWTALICTAVISMAAALSQRDRDIAMSYMHATRKQVLDTLAGLSEEQLKYKPAPDRWSIAEVAEHLIASEGMIADFAKTGLKQSAPDPGADKVDDKALIERMTDRSTKAQAPKEMQPTGRWKSREELERAFKKTRDENIAFLRDTQEDLRGHYVKGPAGMIDVYQGFLFIGAHTERHLKQMAEVKQSPGFPKR
ncbi:MAG: DinB family protein [Bryobacteraceae bacterium]